MGRKIPSKKHRGVKDPIQQQAKRNQILKTKINAPPSDPDDQPVPRSLTELFSFRDAAATRKQKRKQGPAPANKSGKGNPISSLRKLPGESGRGFSLRINSAIRALHDKEEAQEYPQDLEEEDSRGGRMAALRERRQRKTRKKAGDTPQRPSHKDRLKMKKEEAAKALAAAMREQPQYERVPFGARCDAPPALTAPRGVQAADGAARPGRRGLLLSGLLANEAERARLAAVAAYRELNRQRREAQHKDR